MNRDGRYDRCELCQSLRAIWVATVVHKWFDAIDKLGASKQIGLELFSNALQMVNSLTKFITVCLLNLLAKLGHVSQVGIVIA